MGRSRGKPSDITARRKRLQTSTLAHPRLADVARRAGVSTATVSRVLNTPSAVTPPLRASVLAAVETLGYVPHGRARALATQRSQTIGAVIPTVDNAIFAHGIQALQERLFEEGFTLAAGELRLRSRPGVSTGAKPDRTRHRRTDARGRRPCFRDL